MLKTTPNLLKKYLRFVPWTNTLEDGLKFIWDVQMLENCSDE